MIVGSSKITLSMTIPLKCPVLGREGAPPDKVDIFLLIFGLVLGRKGAPPDKVDILPPIFGLELLEGGGSCLLPHVRQAHLYTHQQIGTNKEENFASY